MDKDTTIGRRPGGAEDATGIWLHHSVTRPGLSVSKPCKERDATLDHDLWA